MIKIFIKNTEITDLIDSYGFELVNEHQGNLRYKRDEIHLHVINSGYVQDYDGLFCGIIINSKKGELLRLNFIPKSVSLFQMILKSTLENGKD